jgi:hypothetical protein
MEVQRPQTVKAILSQKNNDEIIIIAVFKLSYRGIVINQHGTQSKTDMKTNGI